MPLLPATNEERLNADILAANSVLSDLIKIGERVCSNATYRNDSSENSINDFFRDTLSLMGYTEVKDQTRQGVSISVFKIFSIKEILRKYFILAEREKRIANWQRNVCIMPEKDRELVAL